CLFGTTAGERPPSTRDYLYREALETRRTELTGARPVHCADKDNLAGENALFLNLLKTQSSQQVARSPWNVTEWSDDQLGQLGPNDRRGGSMKRQGPNSPRYTPTQSRHSPGSAGVSPAISMLLPSIAAINVNQKIAVHGSSAARLPTPESGRQSSTHLTTTDGTKSLALSRSLDSTHEAEDDRTKLFKRTTAGIHRSKYAQDTQSVIKPFRNTEVVKNIILQKYARNTSNYHADIEPSLISTHKASNQNRDQRHHSENVTNGSHALFVEAGHFVHSLNGKVTEKPDFPDLGETKPDVKQPMPSESVSGRCLPNRHKVNSERTVPARATRSSCNHEAVLPRTHRMVGTEGTVPHSTKHDKHIGRFTTKLQGLAGYKCRCKQDTQCLHNFHSDKQVQGTRTSARDQTQDGFKAKDKHPSPSRKYLNLAKDDAQQQCCEPPNQHAHPDLHTELIRPTTGRKLVTATSVESYSHSKQRTPLSPKILLEGNILVNDDKNENMELPSDLEMELWKENVIAATSYRNRSPRCEYRRYRARQRFL
ncbi:hypothetical protein BaRGS_00038606, partial [Batillaria attramentaria]